MWEQQQQQQQQLYCFTLLIVLKIVEGATPDQLRSKCSISTQKTCMYWQHAHQVCTQCFVQRVCTGACLLALVCHSKPVWLKPATGRANETHILSTFTHICPKCSPPPGARTTRWSSNYNPDPAFFLFCPRVLFMRYKMKIKTTTSVRSRVSSKVIFVSCVWCLNREYSGCYMVSCRISCVWGRHIWGCRIQRSACVYIRGIVKYFPRLHVACYEWRIFPVYISYQGTWYYGFVHTRYVLGYHHPFQRAALNNKDMRLHFTREEQINGVYEDLPYFHSRGS